MRVFASSRALRHHLTTHLETNQFIQKAITIGELFSRLVVVTNRTFIDKETRLLLLRKASEFENFDKLQMDRELLSFLHNSEYIFRFFEELSAEGISLEAIDAYDTYVEYEEHLEILHTLRTNYKALLDEENYIDSIFKPDYYVLNTDYLQAYDELEIVLEGYLTKFELQVLRDASKCIPVRIELLSNQFNSKLIQQINTLGFTLEENFFYTINLSTLEIEKQTPYELSYDITAAAFSERILQVAFIKQKVFDYIQVEKIPPEGIIVILPDESFALTLYMHDKENYFNFAKGIPIKESMFIKRLTAIALFFDNPVQEQKHRLKRYIQGYESAFEVMRMHYQEVVSITLFSKILDAFLINVDKELEKVIRKEIYTFSKLNSLLLGVTFKQMLQLFLSKLSQASIDDVRGGKVTVIGLLETRGMSYEGVIVVDFNDAYIPKKSTKDLFLSTAIKAKVGLPTSKDRESLQKYFYARLFMQAKKTSVSYVQSATAMPSKFLTQLGIKKASVEDESHYATILYEKNEAIGYKAKEIRANYDFTSKPLSASKLRTFLSCKRKFYHRYIDRLNNHEIPEDMPQEREVGIWVHDILQEVYTKNKRFDTLASLQNAIEQGFETHKQKGEMGRFLVKMWLEKMHPFYESEIKRFNQGYEVYACEADLTCKHRGLTLTGKIDRMDTRDGMLSILDYKTGSIKIDNTEKQVEKSIDFQLEFYYLLASTQGEVEQACLYDVNKGQLHPEVMLHEKLKKLDEIIDYLVETKTFDFELTDDKTQCKYCEFSLLCNRY